MKVHDIKLQSQFCDAVYRGKKTFEVRKNDRDYQVGDVIRFIPIDNNGRQLPHPIRNASYIITYLLNDYGLRKGYVALAIKRI